MDAKAFLLYRFGEHLPREPGNTMFDCSIFVRQNTLICRTSLHLYCVLEEETTAGAMSMYSRKLLYLLWIVPLCLSPYMAVYSLSDAGAATVAEEPAVHDADTGSEGTSPEASDRTDWSSSHRQREFYNTPTEPSTLEPIVDVRGGPSAAILHKGLPVSGFDPEWSPFGTRLAFAQHQTPFDETSAELFIGTFDDSHGLYPDLVQLTKGTGRSKAPAW
jgi:hypothetical protein